MLFWIIVALLLIIIILFLILFFRKQNPNENEQISKLEDIDKDFLRMENTVKDEFRRNREKMATSSKQTRAELSDSILKRMAEIANLQKDQLSAFSDQLTKLTTSKD
jgi:DNA recombination protein RmuC